MRNLPSISIPPLIEKKNISVPTLFGWGLIAVVSTTFFIAFIVTIHPFLSPVQPKSYGGLIIEGWVPDHCFQEAANRCKNGGYSRIFVTGGPLEKGSYLKEYTTYAQLGASTLKHFHIPDSLIIVVPAPYSAVDRTWGSALALKRWLDSSGCTISTFDLLSHATHTRRSRLFFRRVLGNRYTVGSIAIKNPDYNPAWWWASSTGFRETVDESIAYIYALFFVFSR